MNDKPLVLANIRNGLVYPHDDLCCFRSCDAHKGSNGYFGDDAMPYSAVIHLLLGGTVEIVDATQHDKDLSDALRYGVPVWCRTFNRAVGGSFNHVAVCPWESRPMRIGANSQIHRRLLQTYRKLIDLYGAARAAVIGENVLLTCHRLISWDDQPSVLRAMIKAE